MTAAALPPGPTGPEMLRHIRLMRVNPPAFLQWSADKYGPVVRFPIPRQDVWFVAEPNSVQQVLQAKHKRYCKRTVQYDTLRLVTGDGLLTSDGDDWLKMRRLLSPGFSRQRHEMVRAFTIDAANRWVHQMRERGQAPFDLDAAMLDLSLEVVAKTLLGVPHAEQPEELVAAIISALRVVVARAQRPSVVSDGIFGERGRATLAADLSVVERHVNALIATRRRGGQEVDSDDPLALLLRARDTGDISNTQVRDEIVTLIVAGHETLAANLTWTWLLLAQHPSAESRVHNEADLVAVQSETPFTRAVVSESLRLYPPAWVITRRSLEHDELAGYALPRDSTVIASPYLLHRRPEWADPHQFRPQRFLGDASTHDEQLFVPFGLGPRLCIGRDFALLEAPSIVSTISREFLLRPLQPAAVREDFGVALRPASPVMAMAVPRTRDRDRAHAQQ